ncbi:MAG: ornithine carbamoyltransferase [Phycisphaerae bacterium]|nr:ornithine carbamoyltransferase [Phycisphaerae bacterium]
MKPSTLTASSSARPLPHGSGDLTGRSVLTLADLRSHEIRAVLDLAKTLKRDYAPWRAALAQRAAVLLFEKPSLRTRVSFEIGLAKLGGIAVYLDHQNSPIGQRETTGDYGKNLERWANTIVARVHRHATLEELVAATKVPIINALSDVAHPCQALADALTLEEHGVPLSAAKLAFVGDGNNVCHSLIELTALMGGTIAVVTPPGYAPCEKVVVKARAVAVATGASIEIGTDLALVRGADAIYTDAWISMGQSSDAAKLDAMRALQVTPRVMELAGPKALFMHCLPAHRGEEVVDAVIDSAHSVVFDQAENRMHAQNALMLLVLGASST